jgi:membrane protease YdiL (CAAX protease family)
VGRLVADSRSLTAAATPRRRLWLLLGYWAFGLALRWPIAALKARLGPGTSHELLLFAIKAALSVLLPVLIVRRLVPHDSLAARLGFVAPAGQRRRTPLALAIAVAWFTLIFVLATLQDGHAPSLLPASPGSVLASAAGVLVEEIAFRGFILGWLADDRSFWRANLVTSLMFLSMHLPGWYAAGLRVEMAPLSLILVALSLVLGWTKRLSGTIWLAGALHLANNALSGW